MSALEIVLITLAALGMILLGIVALGALGRTIQLHRYAQALEKYCLELHNHIKVTDEQVIILAEHVDKIQHYANALEQKVNRAVGNTVIVTPHRDPN